MTSDAGVVWKYYFGATARIAVEGGGSGDIPGLGMFSADRMVGYGLNSADAVELRERVSMGEQWQRVASELADTCVTASEVGTATAPTRASNLFRASALLRIGQTLLVGDSPQRRGVYARAADLYDRAGRIAGDRERTLVECVDGDLAGWLIPARSKAVGAAIVLGGIEGWAMDFDALGSSLADRGIDTLMLDAPGQGVTRLIHGSYLSARWMVQIEEAISYLQRRCWGVPVGIVGNSMGATLATMIAARNPRIAACCINGGPGHGLRNTPEPDRIAAAHSGMETIGAPQRLLDMCGTQEQVAKFTATLDPVEASQSLRCPFLSVHGARDPLIPIKRAHTQFEQTGSEDKLLIVFSDGDHCVYNHSDDKHNLIGDWMADRLSRSLPTRA